jgi:hypothetical protein
MSRKIGLVIAILALTVLVSGSSPVVAQPVRTTGVRAPEASTRIKDIRVADEAGGKTLGCCRCLGESNTLDLSTGGSGWTVNGQPALIQTALHPAWNLNPGAARWVSTVANGSMGVVPGGTYEYRLTFVVPSCTIDQTVTLKGNYGGDDGVQVFLYNASGTTPLSACSGGWCFNTRNPPPPFTANVGPGTHTLIFRVSNDSAGPSGLFVNAQLASACTDRPTRDRR